MREVVTDLAILALLCGGIWMMTQTGHGQRFGPEKLGGVRKLTTLGGTEK